MSLQGSCANGIARHLPFGACSRRAPCSGESSGPLCAPAVPSRLLLSRVPRWGHTALWPFTHRGTSGRFLVQGPYESRPVTFGCGVRVNISLCFSGAHVSDCNGWVPWRFILRSLLLKKLPNGLLSYLVLSWCPTVPLLLFTPCLENFLWSFLQSIYWRWILLAFHRL